MSEAWAKPPRFAIALFVLGFLLRLPCLPLWGTVDTKQWKAWTVQALSGGLSSVYGPRDDEILRAVRASGQDLIPGLFTTPLPRTEFFYHGETYFVDYPPGSMIMLWLSGKLFRVFEPGGTEGLLFNAFINLLPLLGSVAIAALLLRSAPGDTGWQRALAFWWNPAVLLGISLMGYQDTVFGAVALMAVMAMAGGRLVPAAGWVVAAGLLKPQGSLLLPTFLALVFVEAGWRVWARAVFAGTVVAALVFAPWWLDGHLLSALDGSRRPLEEVTVSAQSLNLWWIVGYAFQWIYRNPWPMARILTFEDFQTWAQWDPRGLSRLLLALATLGNVVLLLRRPREDRVRVLLSVILQTHIYALLGTSVHENHTYLAVFTAPLLMGLWKKARHVLALTTAFLFLNMFLIEGIGRGVIRDRQLFHLRRLTGLDLTVLVAFGHVLLVVLLFVWVFQRRRDAVVEGP